MAKRRNFSAQLVRKRAKPWLAWKRFEANGTLSESGRLCYEIHPSVITNWKKRAREGLGDVFRGQG